MVKKMVDENLKATIPSTVYDRYKQPESLEYFNYFGSMMTNGVRYRFLGFTIFTGHEGP
jgi:hypothetical protein